MRAASESSGFLVLCRLWQGMELGVSRHFPSKETSLTDSTLGKQSIKVIWYFSVSRASHERGGVNLYVFRQSRRMVVSCSISRKGTIICQFPECLYLAVGVGRAVDFSEIWITLTARRVAKSQGRLAGWRWPRYCSSYGIALCGAWDGHAYSYDDYFLKNLEWNFTLALVGMCDRTYLLRRKCPLHAAWMLHEWHDLEVRCVATY